MKEIYIAANKDKKKHVSEIDILNFKLHGSAPTLTNLEKVSCEHPADVSLIRSDYLYSLTMMWMCH
jgi:hypothetical protein